MTDTDRLTLLEVAAAIRAVVDVANVDIALRPDDPEIRALAPLAGLLEDIARGSA
jgi:predicted PhzF superfamily epimerase YddE/YHI9